MQVRLGVSGLVLVVVVMVAGSTSVAQPGPASPCVPVVRPTLALQGSEMEQQCASAITERFALAVQTGSCDVVVALSSQVRALDPTYYGYRFASDPGVVACNQRVSPPGRSTGSIERDGVFFGAEAGVELGLGATVRLGWVMHSWLAVFATGSRDFVQGEHLYETHLLGGGVRVSFDRLFADARIVHASCDSCDAGTLGVVSFGFEPIHRRHFGLEFHLGLIGSEAGAGPDVGLGFSIYP